MRLFTLSALLLLFSAPAMAGDVVSCGTPVDSDMETAVTENYCDIHQRRIDYYKSDKEFKSQLKERQQNYQAPHEQSLANYRASMESLNAERGSPE